MSTKPIMKLADPPRGAGLAAATLVEQTDLRRIVANQELDPKHRSALGQFMTPAPVARRMASLFDAAHRPTVRLLDAGAGIGSLTAAWVAEFLSRRQRPERISVTAYELDATMVKHLQRTLEFCEAICAEHGVRFEAHIRHQDFIEAGVNMVRGGLFPTERAEFDCTILNPPYRKINTDSKERLLLNSIGAGTTNLYTGFLSLAVRLLAPGGELVAITPRSFCNGRYFRPFRAELLSTMSLEELHVFESRKVAFSGDDVLQENIILHATKGSQGEYLTVSTSSGADEGHSTNRRVPFTQVVRPGDAEKFIRLATDEADDHIAERLGALTHSLAGLGLTVSTGRVVDFRAREHLRSLPGSDTVPLIYPAHLSDGFVAWPQEFKKPNALVACRETESLLVPSGTYVLVKRISAKEEKRRVVATLFDTRHVPCKQVGFENHLNYFHQDGQPLPDSLARGLALFLNSTLVDAFFRQLSGHTQVNAGDLRNLRYPGRQQLEALGRHVTVAFPPQEQLDALIEKELFPHGGATGARPAGHGIENPRGQGHLEESGDAPGAEQ